MSDDYFYSRYYGPVSDAEDLMDAIYSAAKQARETNESVYVDFVLYGCEIVVIPPSDLNKDNYYFWLGDGGE